MSSSDEIAERVRALGNLVDSLQTETRKVAAKARKDANPSFKAEIKRGLGVVEVDTMARLRRIQLDSRRIRTCSAETFAKELVAAINSAEDAARDSLDRASQAASAASSRSDKKAGRDSEHGR